MGEGSPDSPDRPAAGAQTGRDITAPQGSRDGFFGSLLIRGGYIVCKCVDISLFGVKYRGPGQRVEVTSSVTGLLCTVGQWRENEW